MSRVILHIGSGKTGTTAIQAWLKSATSLLKDRGYIYPHLEPGLDPWFNHNRLAYTLCSGRIYVDPADARRRLDTRLAEGLDAVVSAEGFFMRPTESSVATEEEFVAAKSQAIRRVANFFSGLDVQVVCYLRRQDDWLESVYAERVKSFKTADDFAVFVGRSKLADYAWQLDLWSKAFGMERMTIRTYEPSRLERSDAVCDFQSQLGLPTGDGGGADLGGPAFRVENPRLRRDVLEFQRRLNAKGVARQDRERTKYALLAVSKERDLEQGREPAHFQQFFDDRARAALLERHAEGNQRVLEQYRPHHGATLFGPLVADQNHVATADIFSGLSREDEVILQDRFEALLEPPPGIAKRLQAKAVRIGARLKQSWGAGPSAR